MKICDALQFAFLQFRRQLFRSLLTLLGVAIGTACLVTMVAVGLASVQELDDMIVRTRVTEITVTGRMENSGDQLRLDQTACRFFAEQKHITSVIPQRLLPCGIQAQPAGIPYVQVIAVEEQDWESLFQLGGGRLPSADGTMLEMVVGTGLNSAFLSGKTPYLLLGGIPEEGAENPLPASQRYPLQVVGVAQPVEGMEGNLDQRAYIPMQRAEQILRENGKLAYALDLNPNVYDIVVLRVDELAHVEQAAQTLTEGGWACSTEIGWVQELQAQQQAQQRQLALIGLVTLFVSATGIANTMLFRMGERREEIGVLKVLGMTPGQACLLFLMESAAIGLFGGVVGCLMAECLSLAMANGATLELFGTALQAGVGLRMPVWLHLSAVGLAVLVSATAGLLPAWKAARVSPMEAIRHAR